MSVTLRDVAERAGVSVRTVSNVVNRFPYVAEETRARVQAALDELGYRPNLAARNLRRGRSGMIALILPELDVPYFTELTQLVIEVAGQHGYTVIIDQTDGDPERERQVVLTSQRAMLFDGVIFSPLGMDETDLRTRTDRTPIVLLGERIAGAGHDYVSIDNVAAARAATEHLLALGRRRIAAIGDQPWETGRTAQYRTHGYRDALEAAGQRYDPALVVRTPRFHRADGAAAMDQMLDWADPPDAVFCYSDLLALGAMRAALRRGVRVPDDVAIVGFDDIEDGRYSTPTLSSVSPDKRRIAELAVDLLLARQHDDTRPAETHLVDYQLAVRESTGPAPA